MKKLIIILVLTNLGLSLKCSEKIATFEGGFITTKELMSSHNFQEQVYNIKFQENQIKKRGINALLEKKLVELEIKKTGKTKNELINKFIKKNNRPIPETHIKSYYEMMRKRQGLNKPYALVKEKIKRKINNMRIESFERQFFISLNRKYKVKYLLPKIEKPKLNIKIDGKPTIGNKNANIIFVVFSNLECKECKELNDTLIKIYEKYKDYIKIVYRNFLVLQPMSLENTMLPSIAAHCAYSQNKFLEFHIEAFKSFKQLNERKLKQIAIDIKLNEDEFEKCLKDEDYNIQREIKSDLYYGRFIGVAKAPALFINNKFMQEPIKLKYEYFKKYIEDNSNIQ